MLGILDVNGWHNLVHIATGALGLLVAGSYGGLARLRAGLRRVYLLVAILGFLVGDGEAIFDLIPVNTEDNVLHLLIGLAGLGAGLATPAHGAAEHAARRVGLAAQALLEVVRDARAAALERLQAGALALLALLAGAHEHQRRRRPCRRPRRRPPGGPSCAGRASPTAPSRPARPRPRR